ncbi:heme-binding protein [Sinorhizobium meliloti]|nr:heme-binding protein [Sinorhizobium meliloti]
MLRSAAQVYPVYAALTTCNVCHDRSGRHSFLLFSICYDRSGDRRPWLSFSSGARNDASHSGATPEAKLTLLVCHPRIRRRPRTASLYRRDRQDGQPDFAGMHKSDRDLQ